MSEVLKSDQVQKISKSQELLSEFFDNFNSPHTKEAYRRDIASFFDFAFRSFSVTDPVSISRFHVIQFKELLNKELAPKTVNRKLSSISSFMAFLVEKGIVDANPCTNIRRPRQSVKRPTEGLSDEEVGDILTKGLDPDSPSYHLHKSVLFLFFSTGIRRSELINIKLKDLKKHKDSYTLEVLAKGGKYLTKLIPKECSDIINEYINHMRGLSREIAPEDYLLQPTKNPVGGFGKKLSANTIRYIITKACKRAGITKRISAHSARASYISAALEGGANLWHISQDVGHESVQTTEIYNKRRMSLENSPSLKIKYLNK